MQTIIKFFPVRVWIRPIRSITQNSFGFLHLTCINLVFFILFLAQAHTVYHPHIFKPFFKLPQKFPFIRSIIVLTDAWPALRCTNFEIFLFSSMDIHIKNVIVFKNTYACFVNLHNPSAALKFPWCILQKSWNLEVLKTISSTYLSYSRFSTNKLIVFVRCSKKFLWLIGNF